MDGKSDQSRLADAAFELEAAADEIGAYADRLKGLLALQTKTGTSYSESWPDEFRLSFDELYAAHQAGHRAFCRHLDAYSYLKDEWINGTHQQFRMTMTEGLFAVMVEKNSILKRAASIVRKKAELNSLDSRPAPISNYYASVHYGDQYKAEIANALGPHAQASNNVIHSKSDAILPSDFESLIEELRTLRSALEKDAVSAENELSVAHVVKASEAAEQRDAAGVLKHLKAAGTWAFDVATKIGVNIASSALKGSLHLE